MATEAAAKKQPATKKTTLIVVQNTLVQQWADECAPARGPRLRTAVGAREPARKRQRDATGMLRPI